jgi:hypothetical protein
MNEKQKEITEMREIRRNYFLTLISMREDKGMNLEDRYHFIREVTSIFYEIDQMIKKEEGEIN